MANTQRTRADLLNQFGATTSALSPAQAIADLIESLAGEAAAINVTGSSTTTTLGAAATLATPGTATELLATGDMTTTVATHRVTAVNAGVYLVFARASVEVSAAHPTTLELYKTTVATPAAIVGAKAVIKLPVASSTADVTICSVVTLAADDFVQLYITGTENDTVICSELTLGAIRIL